MRFAFIQEHRRRWPIGLMCTVLGVTRGGFYAWLGRGVSGRRRRRAELAAKIARLHAENRRVYGSPRVCAALRAEGERVSEKTVARIMRENRLRARGRRRFKPTTTRGVGEASAAPNRLGREFAAAGPDRKWAADITCVATEEGWLYMAAVLDLCTRKIVGWSMADHMRAELTTEALEMALARRRPAAGLLHHSDRGVQYASVEYQSLLDRCGAVCSMSRRGDCWDNAAMESFWSTLKTELTAGERYATRDQAKRAIFEYVEVFYNRKRLHSRLGYRSPETFEASLN
jgi:transposase InsO family protein